MARKRQRDPVPEFKSYKEEANFWDSHSLADYQDLLKPVKFKFAKNLSTPLTIRMDEKTLNKLREEAHKKGIGPTTLARMWIMERIVR